MDLELDFRRNFHDNLFSILYYRRINFARPTRLIVDGRKREKNIKFENPMIFVLIYPRISSFPFSAINEYVGTRLSSSSSQRTMTLITIS